jgi:hypothetical protein
MVCTCGAMMCYICRQPVKNYSHFNGQGGDAFNKYVAKFGLYQINLYLINHSILQ